MAPASIHHEASSKSSLARSGLSATRRREDHLTARMDGNASSLGSVLEGSGEGGDTTGRGAGRGALGEGRPMRCGPCSFRASGGIGKARQERVPSRGEGARPPRGGHAPSPRGRRTRGLFCCAHRQWGERAEALPGDGGCRWKQQRSRSALVSGLRGGWAGCVENAFLPGARERGRRGKLRWPRSFPRREEDPRPLPLRLATG